MTTLTRNKCLVLNKNWAPVGTVVLQKAIIMLFSEKARIIDHRTFKAHNWEEWSKFQLNEGEEGIHGPHAMFRIPEIILLNNYDKIPHPKVHFSRKNLYKRDSGSCQYCGIKPGYSELTVDHVVPSSHGGKTTWENCVLACTKCNGYKADRTPEQAGMVLRKKPKKPNFNMRFNNLRKVESWQTFLGENYWQSPLEEE